MFFAFLRVRSDTIFGKNNWILYLSESCKSLDRIIHLFASALASEGPQGTAGFIQGCMNLVPKFAIISMIVQVTQITRKLPASSLQFSDMTCNDSVEKRDFKEKEQPTSPRFRVALSKRLKMGGVWKLGKKLERNFFVEGKVPYVEVQLDREKQREKFQKSADFFSTQTKVLQRLRSSKRTMLYLSIISSTY